MQSEVHNGVQPSQDLNEQVIAECGYVPSGWFDVPEQARVMVLAHIKSLLRSERRQPLGHSKSSPRITVDSEGHWSVAMIKTL